MNFKPLSVGEKKRETEEGKEETIGHYSGDNFKPLSINEFSIEFLLLWIIRLIIILLIGYKLGLVKFI